MTSASRSPALLGLALVATCAYAAFASGATRFPAETRVQVVLAALALATAAAWATRPATVVRLPLATRVGLLGLLAFAAWTGLTLVWSVTPDRTWIEINRALAYTLIAGLGVAAVAVDPRALERIALAWLGAAVLVALYAFGGKAIPGVNVAGLVDFNQASVVARLRSPLGYWNALALVCALGLPVALHLSVAAGRPRRERLAGLGAGFLLVCVIGLTYSRGGLIAIAVVITVMAVFSGAGRIKGVLVLAAWLTASVPVLGVAFSRPGLINNAAPLGERITDGRILLLAFIVCLGVLLGLALLAMRREPQLRWPGGRTVGLARGLVTAGAVGLLLVTASLALSERGLPGKLSDAASSFTESKADRQFDPVRLVSTNSGNRWVWWKEAAGAWADRPVGGWGAGSFKATHLRYRVDEIPVAQPHSVPLQFLAETGLVGLLLAYGALGALALAAVSRIRAMAPGRDRDLAVALGAGVTAWAVHGLYDWDWDIPGVTLPALLLLGVLAGRPATPAPPAGAFVDPEGRASSGRTVSLVVATLALVLVAASSILPSWADGKASAAQSAVSDDASDAELRRAAAQAELAARLDPLAVRPLFASAAIARRRGRLLDARRVLLEAVQRQPDSSEAWLQLAGVALQLADRPGFERAAARALELDPRSAAKRSVALAAIAARTPAGASATAVGTPLAPAPVVAVAPVAPLVPVAPTGPTGVTGPTG